MATRKHTRSGRARAPLPDLETILGALADAYALVAVSLTAVRLNDHSGPESVTLRLGVEALNRVYNQLDAAIIQLGSSGVTP